MALWIVAAGLGSIAVAALLTLIFWRMNAPMREEAKRRAEERSDDGGAYIAPIIVAGGAHDRDASNGTSDGTSDAGSDGGGGGGGGK
jgi:hypothetical protein